jgi:ABC-type branched-subunit amino acid transport system substrate-binding protein
LSGGLGSEEGGSIGAILADSVLSGLPLGSLDALYVPVQGEEMALLGPQLALLGFRGILMGSSDCLNLLNQEATRRYVQNMVFPSNFPNSQGWNPESEFDRLFQSRVGAYPDWLNVLGWDAFYFLAQSLKDGRKLSPRKLAARLREVRQFQGVRQTMTFPQNQRMNQSIYMLKFEAGKLHEAKWGGEAARGH